MLICGKATVDGERHERMNADGILYSDVWLISLSLKNNYRSMVAARIGKDKFCGRMNDDSVDKVAGILGDTRLCRLFVEAQFWSMPPCFCEVNFKRKYPPANICFGGKCWNRYREYIDRGVRDGR